MKNILFSLFIFLGAFSAEASFFKPQSTLRSSSMRAVLASVESKIPAKMKAALGTFTVDVDRADIPLANLCKGDLNFDELVRVDPILARKRLLVRPALVRFAARNGSCGIYDGQDLAVAAILHQLAHVYDQSHQYWNNKVDQNNIRRCQQEFQKEKGKFITPPNPVCRYYFDAKYKISDSLPYRSLSDFQGMLANSKNELFLRIGNKTELSSVHEHFAMNLTQALLDPNYACRRPALNSFFEKTLQTKFFPEGSCAGNSNIYTSAGGWKIDIDPKKVYQVHFLFASKAEEISGRWGHAMVRLVTCAPERTQVGPECLEDVAYHVILSYRANIEDVIVNNWDGLMGKYPSQLMMFSLNEIVDEYTRQQWRELISLPLNFTEAQKDLFVQSTLEHFWSYRGKYKFLTNNCATELDQLVRAVLPKSHPYLNVSSMSPLGMYKDLYRYKLTSLDYVADKTKARGLGYYFPSQKEALDKAFANVNNHFRGYADVAEFATRSKAAERREVYERMDSFQEIGASYLIEKYISVLLDRDLQTRMSVVIQNDRNADPVLAESIDKLVAASQNRLPWKFATGGYGIPLATELLTDEEVTKRYREGSTYIAAYREGLLRKFPELTQEINAVKANMELLTNRRRF